MKYTRKILCALGMSALLACTPVGTAQELAYPGADFAKLDTFEGVNLGDADKLFAAGAHRGKVVPISLS